ncbi:hypothetical protein [Fodinicola acaciae]|uniref:hypothetical protein n=1 Tax=Fodinicola acaciae TaxID=2681555 RepID=UPI0013CFE16E|nr:hypothetical protein [Fodinicola acaciae]
MKLHRASVEGMAGMAVNESRSRRWPFEHPVRPRDRRRDRVQTSIVNGMNTTRNRLNALLGLAQAQPGSTTRIRFAVTMIAAFATVVQVIVWLIIGITNVHLDSPWWLLTAAGALAANAALYATDHVRTCWSQTSQSAHQTAQSKESL